ncbi:aldehyde dehydrogenase [Xanthobacter sp. KR7-225]|uniref:aldehyde dehydrogenase n=1 Tax=Xanthobacter sp. KR7-225 TaxID=3156613 RepID=UPI0032B5BDB5
MSETRAPTAAADTVKVFGHHINGRSVPSASGGLIDVHAPATGAVIARIADGGPQEVEQAVAAARTALNSPDWAAMSPRERGKLVIHLAELMERNLDELFHLETLNNGRPLRETRSQISRAPDLFRYNAALAIARRDDVIPVEGPYFTFTKRLPIGVVANISPFNHPLLIACRNIAPTLASGCTTVVKPSEYTPLTVLRLAEIFEDGGLPPGVLNVVTGFGATAGKALVENPGINKLVLTGGTESGRLAGAAAASNFAHQTLELGGKTPVLVFGDYDVDRAVDFALFGAFVGAGQTCVCAARHIVHRSIYAAFVEKLAARANALRVGDPFDPATQVGPVISEKQRQRVLRFVEAGKVEGARLVAGGTVPDDPALAGGFFVRPTVFADVTNQMQIAREEVFGPFTVVIPFDTEEEAIEIANDTPYGLGAAIRTNDITRALRLVDRIDAGIVWINDHHRIDPASPWGGVKLSGTGREYGEEAFNAYFTTKAVMVRTSEQRFDWFADADAPQRLN